MSDPNQRIRRIALFFDFDNIILGLPNSLKFKPKAIQNRVLEEGKIVFKRAYADWSRFEKHKSGLHELGFELFEIPKRKMTGKNSADIRMVVDAMELVISKDHIDTFVLVSGDSDFSPLVGALRGHDKFVIGLGVRDSTSKLLIESCDEFIFYDEITGVRNDTSERAKQTLATSGKVKGGKAMGRLRAEGLYLLLDATRALMRRYDAVWASQIKQTLVRKHPSFNETYHGYATFSKLIEDAVGLGLLKGNRDKKNGNWWITDVGDVAIGDSKEKSSKTSKRTPAAKE